MTKTASATRRRTSTPRSARSDMARHELALTRHEEAAEGTRKFHFEKPAGFSFKPGQSASFTLLDPPAEPNSVRRTFSLASAPFEPELMIATRMREGSH